MALPHLVNVGTFGRFKWAGKPLMDLWLTLEDLVREKYGWVGIYSQHNLLDYGINRGILTEKEAKMLREAMV